VNEGWRGGGSEGPRVGGDKPLPISSLPASYKNLKMKSQLSQDGTYPPERHADSIR